jgi:hypothetical protein
MKHHPIDPMFGGKVNPINPIFGKHLSHQQMPPQQGPDPLELVAKTLVGFNEKKLAKNLVRAFAERASSIEQIDSVAKLAFDIKDYGTSVYGCRKLLSFLIQNKAHPGQIYSVRSNLINALAHANYPEEALELIYEQESLVPVDKDRDLKKAYVLFLLTRRDEAEAILRDRLNDPSTEQRTKDEINFNLGTYELWKGGFKSGLGRFLKYGPMFNTWNRSEYPYPYWDGTPKPGETLAVIAEAGIGDEFINIRFMKHIKDLGMNPVWVTSRQDLADIFNRNGYPTVTSIADVVKCSKTNSINYYCYSMNLPVLLDLSPEDLWYGPYIKPDHNVTVPFSLVTNDLKIGIRWRGNPDYDQDLHRSIPYKDLMRTIYEALKMEDSYEIYSIQRDDGLEDLTSDVIDLSPYLKTFEDTLAIIDDLDVVITSCTSIGHAAAAMGKRTFILTPISAYYTWCHPTEQSPWYGDNLTLIRQTQPRSWKEPLEKLNKYLAAL